jgi:beta-mannosidase
VSDDNCRQVIFIAELWQEDKRLALSLATFTPTKHLALVDPEITVTVSQEEKQLVFDLAAQSLARFVELKLEGIDAIFSDNYFDLPAGRTVRVSCPLPDGWTVDRARPALRLYSLYNSFT